MMKRYRIRECRLPDDDGIVSVETALTMRNATSRRTTAATFMCLACSGDLVIHATNPPHFEHARSTDDRPQPDCRLRFIR